MLSHKRAFVLAGLICTAALALACEENGRVPYGSQSNVNANRSDKAGAVTTSLTEADRQFAIKAATAGKHEVEFGRLAAQQASNPDVKTFANRMVQDHSRAGDELTQLASRLGINVPSDEDPLFKQTLDRVSKLKGAEFDRAYMNEMVEGHLKVASEVESYFNNGANPDLKAWASKTLPVVRDHLQMAQSIVARIGVKTK